MGGLVLSLPKGIKEKDLYLQFGVSKTEILTTTAKYKMAKAVSTDVCAATVQSTGIRRQPSWNMNWS